MNADSAPTGKQPSQIDNPKAAGEPTSLGSLPLTPHLSRQSADETVGSRQGSLMAAGLNVSRKHLPHKKH
jgi:hypothetical protein